MKSDVPWARASLQLYKGGLIGCNRAGGRVEMVEQHFVQAEIGNQQKAIVGRGFYPVSVRAFLAFFVGAEGAGVLHERGVFAELTVRENGKDYDISGAVVGNENVFAGAIEGDVAGICAERWELIERDQFFVGSVDGKRADHAALAGFVHGVEIFPVGMDGYKRRV